MVNPFGEFTEEALTAYQKALVEQSGVDFSESKEYDFTTCIRPDGSAYGTGGKCRKGTEGEVPLNDPKSTSSRGTPLARAESVLQHISKKIENPDYSPTDKEMERYGRLKNAVDEMRNRTKNTKVKPIEKTPQEVKNSIKRALNKVQETTNSGPKRRETLEELRVTLSDAKDQVSRLKETQKKTGILSGMFQSQSSNSYNVGVKENVRLLENNIQEAEKMYKRYMNQMS